ncbi:MAG: DUF6036 family nucleotidyltransferase [Tepidisphaeraceae bacterium]
MLATDDPRTQLLVRDAVIGLRHFWGAPGLAVRLHWLPQREAIESFLNRPADEIGFPSLKERIVNVTDPAILEKMFRDIGSRLHDPTEIVIGGSMALMIESFIARHTEDVDIVDELPPALRQDHALLQRTVDLFGLRLTHFQSHYLPDGWQDRTISFGVFGRLTVRLVDPLDMLAGKVFSRRDKDFKDVLAAWPKIDQAALRQRITHHTTALRKVPDAAEAGTHNWYVLTGEELLP